MMRHLTNLLAIGIVSLCSQVQADGLVREVNAALERSGDNREQIEQALAQTPADQLPGMRFLVAYMPEPDLKSLRSDMLVENVRLAYQALAEAPWKDDVPEDVFFNDVLPYASINEKRDDWRKEFYEKFKPLVRDAKSPAQAAAILNQEIFPLLKVRYSTQRRRADQGPRESIESGLASCTGLSILLIDACRAVGVPARFAGTPLWTNKSGNHSWVEIWDNGWHFTGAAEPTGDELDKGWFVGRAATAQRDHRLHAIYAVSYRPTPQKFPLVWNRNVDYVFAVNVTDRYTALGRELPAGHVELLFRAIDEATGDRCVAPLAVRDQKGNVVFEGQTKDERFDANDHLSVVLPAGEKYDVEIRHGARVVTENVAAEKRDSPITFRLKTDETDDPGPADEISSRTAVQRLEAYLAIEREQRPPLEKTSFWSAPLTREDAERARQLLWDDHVATIRQSRAAEIEARELALGDLKMPFHYEVFGEKPEGGRSMFISLHGGGGAPKRVNDRQWENQKGLYQPEEGVYVAPRGPTDTWNLWHQGHVDEFFARLIEDMIVFEEVNPDRVYLMGYSAGGDGVYQLAPRMADRWAAAAMMAGHPNDASPLGLRNIAFTLHVGGNDAPYDRNRVAAQWQAKLADLQKSDPDGYVHWAKIYPDKGHWLDREDAAAIPWMAEHTRDPYPTRIVWKQDDVVQPRFYWLAVDREHAHPGQEIRADREGQQIRIDGDVTPIRIRLNDQMLNLDQPVRVLRNGDLVFANAVPRTIGVIATTLHERGDPRGMFPSEVVVTAE